MEKESSQQIKSINGDAGWKAAPGRAALVISLLRHRRAPLLQAALMILVGWWVYWPVLHGDWIGDDNLYLAENPLLKDPARVWKAWFQPGSFLEYYPLQETVQWMQWRLWGNHTLGYHVTNVILHLASAFLFWRLLAKFRLRLAWLGGLIFIIHPVMVESVAWISELKNTLSLPPLLLAMCAWIDYEEHGRVRDYWLALGFFLAAMLCKIALAMFPLVILLYAWWKRERLAWNDLKITAPFFLISLTLSLISLVAGQQVGHGVARPALVLHLGGFFYRLDLAGLIISFYFAKSLVPVWPSSAYFEWTVNPHLLGQFLPWPILLGVICWLWSKRLTWGRHALLGLGFFLINLAPFLGFISVSYMLSSWVYDHLLYMPIVGLIGLVVAGLGRLDELLALVPRLCSRGIFAILLALLAWESHDYAKVWINEEAVSLYDLKLNPQNSLLHFTLGYYLDKKGRHAEATLHYEQALEINPNYAQAHYNLGVDLAQEGKIEEAASHFQSAVDIAPSYADAHYNLGLALELKGRMDEAMAHYQEALELNPKLAEAHYRLALALVQKGRVNQAIIQFQQALEIDSNDVNVRANLGLALSQAGEFGGAADQFKRVLEINPNDANAHTNLGIAFSQMGKMEEAVDQFKMVLEINPNDADAHTNLGIALLQQGQTDQAIGQLQEALRLKPNLAAAQINLAKARAMARNDRGSMAKRKN